jgi:A118 family predicted phage portal protein
VLPRLDDLIEEARVPIPTEGAWPPVEFAPAYSAYRDWDAWYDGSADKLRSVYRWRDSSGQSLPPSQRVHAGQYAGGLVGTISRWLWGSPPPAGARDGRIHIPLPADLARTAADLIFSEPPAITSENKAVTKRLEQLEEDGLHKLLLQSAEVASAFGDVYLRPVRDPDIYPDRAFLAAVHADGAIPVIRWGRLLEVTFWSVLATDGDRVVRLLEHHEVVNGAGRIVHAVHEGTQDKLGRAVPLTEYATSAHLVDLLDEDGVEPTGLSRLDVVRIDNTGPQRKWRTIAGLKYLGRSDFDGNEPIFDNIDETWTNWMRDVRLAKARIIVPEHMLQSQGRGAGATFDADREVWAAVATMGNREAALGQQLHAEQFEIRWQEHQETADALVEQALRHAGLSSQTLGGDDGPSAQTATEVQARERMSFTTRGNRITGAWKPGIATAVELLLEYERAWGLGQVEPEKPNVEFGDSVSDGPETVARVVQLLNAASAISIETSVRMVHPDWDDTQVREEIARIREDQRSAISVEETLGSHAGNSPPGDDDQDEDDPAEDPKE